MDSGYNTDISPNKNKHNTRQNELPNRLATHHSIDTENYAFTSTIVAARTFPSIFPNFFPKHSLTLQPQHLDVMDPVKRMQYSKRNSYVHTHETEWQWRHVGRQAVPAIPLPIDSNPIPNRRLYSFAAAFSRGVC